MKTILVVLCFMSLTACGTMTPKDMLKGANAVRNISKITTPGVKEELVTMTKDVFDPMRGGGFNK
mgnify:FL=1